MSGSLFFIILVPFIFCMALLSYAGVDSFNLAAVMGLLMAMQIGFSIEAAPSKDLDRLHLRRKAQHGIAFNILHAHTDFFECSCIRYCDLLLSAISFCRERRLHSWSTLCLQSSLNLIIMCLLFHLQL